MRRSAEVGEDLRAHSIVAEIGGKPQFFVGLDGVEALFLEFVGVDFRRQADAAAFLAEVEQDSALVGDLFHGRGELAAAVAAFRVEHITCQALGMNPDEGGFFGIDFTAAQGEVVTAVGGHPVKVAVELAEFGGHFDEFLADHEFFRAAAVFDELGDGAGLESMAASDRPRGLRRGPWCRRH